MAGKKETLRTQSAAATKKATVMGLLFALALTLTFIENMVLSAFEVIPGVRVGLSNIVTMYCLFFLGGPHAYALAFLKALFVLLTRGMVSSWLSLAGGVLSVTVMLLLTLPKKWELSYMLLSIAGAISHNLGQIVVVMLYMNWSLPAVLAYLPVLLLSGVGMGLMTSIILKLIMPPLKKLGAYRPRHKQK